MISTSSTCRLLATSLIVAFGSSFPSGYFMLVYNVPQDIMEQFINQSSSATMSKLELIATWSTVAGIDQIGRFISCFIAPICADRFGRRNTLLIWALPAFLGFILQHLSYAFNYYPLLAMGRLITGIYNGLVGIVVPLFLVEIAISSDWRGAVTRIHNVVIVLGNIIALIFGLPELFGTQTRWSWLPILPVPLLCMEIVWLYNVPESPLHLIEHEKSSEEIERSFAFYTGTVGRSDWKLPKTRKTSKWTLIKSINGRRMMGLWLTLALTVSLNGGSLTNNYSTAILVRFGAFSMLAKYSSIVINIFKFIATLCALYIIDRLGRRAITIACSWIVMLCYVLLMGISVFTPIGLAMQFTHIIIVLVWTANQYIVNSTAVLIVSESCQQNVRALGLSIYKVIFHVVSVMVTIIFPAIANFSEPLAYALLAIPYLIILLYLTIVCPETGQVDMLKMEEDYEENSIQNEHTPLACEKLNS